jgi:hypothetical protein
VLDRKIADQFLRGAVEAWCAAFRFISAAGFPSERTYDFDEARDKVLNAMRTDLEPGVAAYTPAPAVFERG